MQCELWFTGATCTMVAVLTQLLRRCCQSNYHVNTAIIVHAAPSKLSSHCIRLGNILLPTLKCTQLFNASTAGQPGSAVPSRPRISVSLEQRSENRMHHPCPAITSVLCPRLPSFPMFLPGFTSKLADYPFLSHSKKCRNSKFRKNAEPKKIKDKKSKNATTSQDS